MNVIDLIAEQKSKARYNTLKSDAWEYFVKQKSAIDWITATAWYEEIKAYREREILAAHERLGTMKSEDIKGVQAELKLATRFLDFLSNIQNAELS